MFNYRLFSNQILFTVFLLFICVGIDNFFFSKKASFEPSMLKVDVNRAEMNELVKVPYIGKKTAEKIIYYREISGKINSLEELKIFRYYKKFKYFLRVE